MGLGDLFLKLLVPHGDSMPEGEYLTGEGTFTSLAHPAPHVVFKLPLFDASGDDTDSYVVVGDDSTVFIIDGIAVNLDEALDRYGSFVYPLRVTVVSVGRLARMEWTSSAAAPA